MLLLLHLRGKETDNCYASSNDNLADVQGLYTTLRARRKLTDKNCQMTVSVSLLVKKVGSQIG